MNQEIPEEDKRTPWRKVNEATSVYAETLHGIDYKDSIITNILRTYDKKEIRVLGVPNGSLGKIHHGINEAVIYILEKKDSHFASMNSVMKNRISETSDGHIHTIAKALSDGEELDYFPKSKNLILNRPWRKELFAAYENPETKLAIGFLAVNTTVKKTVEKEIDEETQQEKKNNMLALV